MSLYLSFLSVLLIPTKESVIFSDLNNNQMDLSNYCSLKPSVLKCCNDGELLDDAGVCKNAYQFEDVFYNTNYYINAYSWDEKTEQISETNKMLSQDLIFVQNKKLAHSFDSKVWQHDNIFYILEDGSLKIRTSNSTAPWLAASPLQYCVDYRVHSFNEETTTTFTYKLAGNGHDKKVKNDKSITATGPLVAILLLTLETYSHMKPDGWNLRSHVNVACASTLLATFLLELLHYLSLTQQFVISGCAFTGPIIYYLVLSNFFWAIIVHYRKLLNVQQIHRFRQKKVESASPVNTRVSFFRYGVFAWGTPLLVTMAAVLVDRLALNNAGSGHIQTISFDNCFANDQEKMFYVYVPVLLLSTICYVLFLITTYYELVLRCVVRVKNKYKSLNELRLVMASRLTLTLSMAAVVRGAASLPAPLYYALQGYHVFMVLAVAVIAASMLLKPCLAFYHDSWVIHEMLDFVEAMFENVNFKFCLT